MTSFTKATVNLTVWSQKVVGRRIDGEVCNRRCSAYMRMRKRAIALDGKDVASIDDFVIAVYALVSIESICLDGRVCSRGNHCKRV